MKAPRRVHVSWLIAWASLGIVIGSFLALYTVSFVGYEWLFVAGCLLIIGLYKHNKLSILVVLLAGLFIGLFRAGNEIQAQQSFVRYFGESVQVSGRVKDDPSYDVDGDTRLRLIDVVIEGEPTAGELWLATSEQLPIKRSDRVRAVGLLTEGFGTIPASMYRADILSVTRQDYSDVGRDVRDSFATGVRDAIAEPQASLGAGFLLGQKTALPEKLTNELVLLGLTHIVVASGYNLTILVRFARKLFARISRFSALAASGFLILGFLQLTGFSPSMSRASLIASLSLVAWYFGRVIHPLVLLPFSAAVTVLVNPAYAWGDIGWLLSFTSFIGVIMLAPLIHAYFWGDKKPHTIRQLLIETSSAQLLTLPIVALIAGQYSGLSLLANAVILPLIPLAMLLTFIAGLVGLLVPSIAGVVGWPGEFILSYMTTIIERLAALPQATSEVAIGISFAIFWYAGLFITMVYLWRRSGYEFRTYSMIE